MPFHAQFHARSHARFHPSNRPRPREGAETAGTARNWGELVGSARPKHTNGDERGYARDCTAPARGGLPARRGGRLREGGRWSSAGAAGTTQPDRATSAGATKASPPADTRAVCAPVDGEIKNTLAKVAEAEAIGPPAGHHAVSAQWSAGAATIYSLTTGVTGPAADAAAALAERHGGHRGQVRRRELQARQGTGERGDRGVQSRLPVRPQAPVRARSAPVRMPGPARVLRLPSASACTTRALAW